MTPKEKAKEIYDMYHPNPMPRFPWDRRDIEIAKENCIIAIRLLTGERGVVSLPDIEYWEEVELEISLL